MSNSQQNQVIASTDAKHETIEVPYTQTNITKADYTGVIGLCAVILLLGVIGYTIAHYWLYKLFRHKQQIDQKRLELECVAYGEVNEKLDVLIVSQRELTEEIKQCK